MFLSCTTSVRLAANMLLQHAPSFFFDTAKWLLASWSINRATAVDHGFGGRVWEISWILKCPLLPHMLYELCCFVSPCAGFVNRAQHSVNHYLDASLTIPKKADRVFPTEAGSLILLLQMRGLFSVLWTSWEPFPAYLLPLLLCFFCRLKYRNYFAIFSLIGPRRVTLGGRGNYVVGMAIGLSCSLPLRRCFNIMLY